VAITTEFGPSPFLRSAIPPIPRFASCLMLCVQFSALIVPMLSPYTVVMSSSLSTKVLRGLPALDLSANADPLIGLSSTFRIHRMYVMSVIAVLLIDD
jgi:hypothetical protein